MRTSGQRFLAYDTAGDGRSQFIFSRLPEPFHGGFF
jgi:hypothetical protein